jgi:hypothetical protein
MLTVEEMNQIILEVGLGKPEQLNTPEANAFRKKIREETADIERRGWMVDTVAE